MKPVFRLLPVVFVVTALVLIHCLIGGTRPAFSLPAYALLAVAGLTTFRWPRVSIPPETARCLGVAAGVVVCLLLRAAFSPVPYLARADIFLLLGCFAIYLLTACILTTAAQRMLIVAALLVLGIAHAGVSVVQAAQSEDFMLFGFVRPPTGSRASGLFFNPNHLAGFLEMAGALGLSIAWWSVRKPVSRIFAGYAALCCYVGLLLSQSRGGVICAGVSLFAWAALTLRAGFLKDPRGFQRTLLLGVSTLTILLCLCGWFALQHLELRERLATTLERDVRLANWQAGLAQFRSAPIFGTGAGTHLYLGRFFRQPELQSDPVHVHNDYLELLAEYGLVGTLGMLAFLAVHANHGLRALGQQAAALRTTMAAGSDELALLIGALAAFAGLAAHSFVDFNFHIPGNALVMAFLFGVFARPDALSEIPENGGPKTGSAVWNPVLLTLCAGLAALAIVAWPGEFFTERARLHLRDEEFPQAILEAQRAQKLDPWNPLNWFHLGEALRHQAELESQYADRQAMRQQAENAFREGLRHFPQDENLLVRRAQVLDRLKRFEEAEASFLEAIKVDPQLRVLRELYEKHRLLTEDREPAGAR